MATYAIGYILDMGKLCGYRLMSSINFSIKDIEESQLKYLLSKGNKVENLKLDNNKIEWTNGSMERYPAIAMGICIKNETKATILGVLGTSIGTRKYSIANWQGKQLVIDEQRLIAYGRKYGLTNGKIVEGQHGYFISSISGTFISMDDKLQIRYDEGMKSIYIKLPSINPISTLELSNINLSYSNKVEFVIANPPQLVDKIDTIIFGEGISVISKAWGDTFKNVKNIVCKAKTIVFGPNSFCNSKIETVKTELIGRIEGGSFSNCLELRTVDTTTNYIGSIFDDSFTNTPNIDIQHILDQVYGVIGSHIFNGDTIKNVSLPRCKSSINQYAFEGLNGLTDIFIYSPVLRWQNYYNDDLKMQWFRGTIHTVEGAACLNNLAPIINVEYITNKYDKDTKALNAKMSLLGIGISIEEAITEASKANIILRAIKDEYFKTAIKDASRKIVNLEKGYKVLEVCGYNITYEAYGIESRKVTEVFETDQGVALKIAKNWAVISYNKIFIANDNTINPHKDLYFSWGLVIRPRKIKNPGKIKDIKSDSNTLIVEMVTGAKYTFKSGDTDGMW